MMNSKHVYDNEFYCWVDRTATRSARRILPIIKDLLSPASVLDVGCGRGAWLSVWRELGVSDFQGVDGEYVSRGDLLISSEVFCPVNLENAFDLMRKFDMVECLEVGEHLSDASSRRLVESIALHADAVLFSAAQPGQGGEFHINEQLPSYWRSLFIEHDYRMFDFIRPLVYEMRDVDPWYKYNSFLFLRGEALIKVGSLIGDADVTDVKEILDLSPSSWKLRKKILSSLPRSWVDVLSRARYRMMNVFHKEGGM